MWCSQIAKLGKFYTVRRPPHEHRCPSELPASFGAASAGCKRRAKTLTSDESLLVARCARTGTAKHRSENRVGEPFAAGGAFASAGQTAPHRVTTCRRSSNILRRFAVESPARLAVTHVPRHARGRHPADSQDSNHHAQCSHRDVQWPG